MSKWICCPRCGPGIKLFKMPDNTLITGDPIEQKCRRCGNIVLISGAGETRITTEKREPIEPLSLAR